MFKKALYLSFILTILWISLSLAMFDYSMIVESLGDDLIWNLFVIWFISFGESVIIIDTLNDL